MIEVVNIRGYGFLDKPVEGGYYVYCGRPSHYGNMFTLKEEKDRDKVIADFKRIQLPRMDLTDLVDKAREGDLYLGCFCSPKSCHCDAIKDRVEFLLTQPPPQVVDID